MNYHSKEIAHDEFGMRLYSIWAGEKDMELAAHAIEKVRALPYAAWRDKPHPWSTIRPKPTASKAASEQGGAT